MDALSWLLVCWIGFAGLTYLFLTAILDHYWSPTAKVKEERNLVNEILPVGESSKAVDESIVESRCSSSWWLNDLIQWFVEHYGATPDFVQQWLNSMNESAKKKADTLDYDVVFEEASFGHPISPPTLSSVKSEFGPRDHLTLRGHLRFQCVLLRVSFSKKVDDQLITQTYEVTLQDLSAKMQIRVACLSNDLFLMGCFDGRPEVTITARQVDDKKINSHIDLSFVESIVEHCLMYSVTNVDLNSTRFLSGSHTEEILRKLTDSGLHLIRVKQLQVPQKEFTANDLWLESSGRQILALDSVYVVRPYVVVELDTPSQNHVTTQGLNKDPFWEDRFLFELNRKSREMLFEIYDNIPDSFKPKFLGLTIVSVEELRQSLKSIHSFTLQGRPYSADAVSGKLYIEFAFMNEIEKDILMQSLNSCSENQINHTLLPLATIPPRLETIKDMANLAASVPISRTPSPVNRRMSPEVESDAESKVIKTITKKNQLQVQTSTPSSSGANLNLLKQSKLNQLQRNTSSYSESETSVVSDESVYQHSSLVVEATENGIKKYYLIAPGLEKLSSTKKMIKKGKKLHIFNEHTFVATKVTTGHFCSVCMKTVRSTFRKQGYRCRDCRMLCHKRCHYKTETHCPSSNIFNMEM
ncbi:Protein kinase C-like 3 [Trichinella pseudospiralis]|uniref:Protein kinase C-like 3 n=1 Tax=Trichinella pseudospiralis TaxID=6337 RepID=A0A0V0XGR7_TRIPS|nr:Protein kinase C-like 3 [Trichinella pseudospiralis]KRX87029.1 Protein kinase C-like 3 [Trichinella pseudospiralis]